MAFYRQVGEVPPWAHVRSLFTSFDTCSVLEPVDDLVDLGLLSPPERIRA